MATVHIAETSNGIYLADNNTNQLKHLIASEKCVFEDDDDDNDLLNEILSKSNDKYDDFDLDSTADVRKGLDVVSQSSNQLFLVPTISNEQSNPNSSCFYIGCTHDDDIYSLPNTSLNQYSMPCEYDKCLFKITAHQNVKDSYKTLSSSAPASSIDSNNNDYYLMFLCTNRNCAKSKIILTMHSLCYEDLMNVHMNNSQRHYDKKHRNRSSQFNQQQSNIEIECNICHNGIIKILESANPIQFMSSSAAPQSDHVDHAKYVKKQQTLPIRIAKNKTSSNNVYNNPPLPMPMHNEVANTNSTPPKKTHKRSNATSTMTVDNINASANQGTNRNRTISCGSTMVAVINQQQSTSPTWKPSSLINNRRNTITEASFRNIDDSMASTGSMFHKRNDWSIIKKLPVNKQNPINIRLEDDGPYGNDEIRCFVLSHFSSLFIREIECIICGDELRIYDRFPLIDGTLFITPVQYALNNKSTAPVQQISARISNKDQFIYGVCLCCMNAATSIKCKACNQPWKSSTLQIGTLYKYDIFAAFPCCPMRLTCNKCTRPIVAYAGDQPCLPYFSSYSEEIECPHCKTKDYHFIKPFENLFYR